MPRCCCASSSGWLAAVLGLVAAGSALVGVAAGSDDGAKAAPPAAPAAKESAKAPVGDPYTLTTCPVSGETLDAKAVTFTQDGREFRFCCEKCVGTFKAEPAKYTAAVDRKMVEDQKAVYPLTTCVVMTDETLVEGDTEDIIVNNRLFRVCCPRCAKKVKADPAKYMKELDAAVVAARKASYKADTCPVSGEKLGSMGEPVNLVIANRLVRLCCAGCEKEARKNAPAVLAKVK